jgi:hypothetical protein
VAESSSYTRLKTLSNVIKDEYTDRKDLSYYPKYRRRNPEYYLKALEYNRVRAKEQRKLNPEKYRDYDRKRKAKNPDHIRAINKKSNDKRRHEKFGLPQGWYTTQYEKQNGSCAICYGQQEGKPKDFAIDHNHSTGQIRGLLCNRCNTSIGKFKEDPEILLNAIKYLKEYSEQQT